MLRQITRGRLTVGPACPYYCAVMGELLCIDLGESSYAEALELQTRLVERLQGLDRQEAYLILTEHVPPVITLGVSAAAGNVLATRRQLEAEGIELHKTRRGGDVTYHGPGQLVCYPVLQLRHHGKSLRRYQRDLEEVVIRTLARLGVQASRRDGLTGVWTSQGKIAAIGVAVSKWVSYHGFALNVSPRMDHFQLIVPCGLADERVTSLEMLTNRSVTVEQVKPFVIAALVDVFGFANWRQIEPGQAVV